MNFKSTCKYFFPGDFSKMISTIEDAYNEANKREKKKIYLQVKKDFDSLKKKKRNSCKNNSVEKKIDIISLLLIVLDYDIEINETNMVKIYHELDEVEKELDKLNISINSVNKGEKLIRDKIKELYDKIKFSVNVNLLIKNTKYQANKQEANKKRNNNFLNNLQKRVKELKGGKTRKLKH